MLAEWSDQQTSGAGFYTPRTIVFDHGSLELVKSTRNYCCLARRAGISPPIAQGPPKFFTSTDDRGRLVYYGFGSTMPATMQDLFVDESTWDQINDWIESYLAEIQRVQGGYRFVPGHVINGKDGVDVDLETMHEM